MNRSRVGDEWHARAIRPFGGSFHAPHDAVGLQCDCHRALIVRKWRTVRPEQLPRATPFAGAEKRAMPPERCRCLVVIGDPPGGISGVDRGRQCIEQITKPAFALAQGRMGPGAINRHNIVAGGRLTECGDSAVKFTLKESDRLVHFRGIPPYANWRLARRETSDSLARTRPRSKSCAGCGKFSAV
jgi:hypothetical protein